MQEASVRQLEAAPQPPDSKHLQLNLGLCRPLCAEGSKLADQIAAMRFFLAVVAYMLHVCSADVNNLAAGPP